MFQYLYSQNIIILALIATILTGISTGIGALVIFATSNVSKKCMDAWLGSAAGVMLAATSFSLIVPAIEYGGGGMKGSSICLAGILLGGFFLILADKFFPDPNLMLNSMGEQNETVNGFKSLMNPRLRKTWLFILAITIHNFPEGLAVGVGFGNGDIKNGITLAIAIGLQNLPEGLAVALPLLREGYTKWKAFVIALATGLVEPIGGLLGAGLVQISRPFLPLSMAFAAGAMIYVISHEIIPETHSEHSHSKLATIALMIGFVIMMFLDNSLG